MHSSMGVPGAVPGPGLDYKDEYRTKVSAYLAQQQPIVRGLNRVLQVLAWLCLANAIVFFCVALYQTLAWATTGATTSLADAWVNFGLSMSLLVFPWGLDSMLVRVFPAVIFPLAWYRSNRPIPFMTGTGAFFAGLGITCAGAPGAVHFFSLASQALQQLF
jgi:hypothetical protein